MPVLTEETAAEPRTRRRSSKALLLLLIPPLLVVGLVVSTFVAPLELRFGPVMVISAAELNPGLRNGLHTAWLSNGQLVQGARGRRYQVTGDGWGAGVAVPQRLVAIAWFRGYRKKE
jgi:hypothetical protein